MRITALTENTAKSEEFGAEHGLSLYLETKGYHILFDMGQTALFEQNAAHCGINLKDVDIAVLSHGHYDHGGGLKRFLEINDHAPVYANRCVFEPHYNAQGEYIGLDPSLQGNSRLILTEDAFRIDEGITLYSCNDIEKPFPIDSGGLSMMQEGRLIDDDFRHEQVLLVEEEGKRILISGCSHKGVLNYVAWFRPDVLIGGFHFMKLACDDTLRGCAEALNRRSTEYYTCHCTGLEQYAYMKRFMNRLHYLSAGQSVWV